MLNDLKAAYQNFAALPFPMRLAYALGVVFCLTNLVLLAYQGTSASWKIDQGIATFIAGTLGSVHDTAD